MDYKYVRRPRPQIMMSKDSSLSLSLCDYLRILSEEFYNSPCKLQGADMGDVFDINVVR